MKFNRKRFAVCVITLSLLISSLVSGTVITSAEGYDSTATLTGNGDGSFTVAAMNVDGLPSKINIAGGIFSVDLNPDGPGAEYTAEIGRKMAARGWDIIGLSENFNYSSTLFSALGGKYNISTANTDNIPENVSLVELDSVIAKIPFDTDGLSLLSKTSVKVTEVDRVRWTSTHSTYETYGIPPFVYTLPTGSGADDLIRKGFRFFTAELADGVTVDVYIMHMDAEDSDEDKAARADQIRQLAKYILNSSTKNPVIIMGDLNCRYTRDRLKTLLIDTVNADPRFTAQDAWVEYAWGGKFPTFGGTLMDESRYPYPQAEIVDKIIYINNTDSNIHLRLDSYSVDTSFVKSDGSALADHWPIVAKFTYAKKHTITYNDGAGGAVFGTTVITDALTGNPTPAFPGGAPTRSGYTFAGWSPSLSSKVTGDATYTATWQKNPETTTASTTSQPVTTSAGGSVTDKSPSSSTDGQTAEGAGGTASFGTASETDPAVTDAYGTEISATDVAAEPETPEADTDADTEREAEDISAIETDPMEPGTGDGATAGDTGAAGTEDKDGTHIPGWLPILIAVIAAGIAAAAGFFIYRVRREKKEGADT